MIVHYLLLLLILALGYPLCVRKPSSGKTLLYLAITFGAMWFFATFRGADVGYDYTNYVNNFRLAAETPWGQIFSLGRFEPGFMAVTKLITYLTSSPVGMYGIYNLLGFAPVAYFIFKHCKEETWLSVWMYVTMVFYFTNMNFIRQALACAVGVFAYRFLLEKKPIPYMLIALLAGSFHKTALILIPIYLIVQIPLTKITGAIYGVLVLVIFATSDLIIEFVTGFIFEGYRGERYVTTALGGRFMLIPLVCLIIGASLFVVWRKRDPYAGVMLNLLILNATFWLFGSFRHMILERFCMYTYIYTLAILPRALSALKAGPGTVEQRDSLVLELGKQRNPRIHQVKQLEDLEEQISDGNKYYWSAVIAFLFLSFLYIYFGMTAGGFHKVVNYRFLYPELNGLFGLPLANMEMFLGVLGIYI